MEDWFYHNWFYVHVLNAKWFIWGAVGFIFLFNLLAPVVYWLTFSGRSLRLLKRDS